MSKEDLVARFKLADGVPPGKTLVFYPALYWVIMIGFVAFVPIFLAIPIVSGPSKGDSDPFVPLALAALPLALFLKQTTRGACRITREGFVIPGLWSHSARWTDCREFTAETRHLNKGGVEWILAYTTTAKGKPAKRAVPNRTRYDIKTLERVFNTCRSVALDKNAKPPGDGPAH